MDKAPDAFRTISEVAEEINVPQHVLRFWESRFAQIRPMKRGGGRRYYRPDDVDLLRGVRHLLYGEGYTIRGVQRILREGGIGFVQNVWRPGTEPSPPEAEEDRAGDDGAEIPAGARAEQEPSFFGAVSSRPRRRDINSEDRRKLQTALDDLIACRRLIDAALAEDYSDDAIGRSGEIRTRDPQTPEASRRS